MAEKNVLSDITERIKSFITEPINIDSEKSIITTEIQAGIKGISLSIECQEKTIKVKGSREYKYPIIEAAVDKFQNDMSENYGGYNIYVAGQVLYFSKFFAYHSVDEAVGGIKAAVNAVKKAVEAFENSCVNFMEQNEMDAEDEYNPESNVDIVDVDDNYHVVPVAEQDNSDYDEEHKKFAEEAFDNLLQVIGGERQGNEIKKVDKYTIKCILFPLDAEIMVSVSVHVSRDISAMYESFIVTNYPEVTSSYNADQEQFIIKKFSYPDKYAPNDTEDMLELCIKAMDDCVNEYEQTLKKKDSADFASDVQDILTKQTESIAEQEKLLAEKEKDMMAREKDLKRREIELVKRNEQLEKEITEMKDAIEKEKAELKEKEKQMADTIKEYQDRNTKDILNIQQLANQVAALKSKQSALGSMDDSGKEELFRMKSKVQQLTSQKIALEKKLTEKIINKESKIREMSDFITQKENEIRKLEQNVNDMVKSQVSEEIQKTDEYVKALEEELKSIGHILTPMELIDYYKNTRDTKVRKLHSAIAEFVVFNDETLEIRIRFGDVNYVDVSRKASLKDQVLKKLNAQHNNIKFFNKEDRIVARMYIKRNASAEEVDDVVMTLSDYFQK